MTEIIPAVLPETFTEIEIKAAQVAGLAPLMQIDLVDGKFAPHKTWWFNGKNLEQLEAIEREEQGLPLWDKINFEIDAMVADPRAVLPTLIMLGPTRIIFHIESLPQDEWKTFFASIDQYYKEQIEFGMALNTTTDPETLVPILPHIRFIQCMGIEHVGFQGQPFDERVLKQITQIKTFAEERPISVDGGVTLETAPLLIDAGATRLVVGSALFGSNDIRGTLESFKAIN